MSTATNPMGLKRICTSCGARFFDMNKRPIVCPACSTEFTGEIKVKSRRGRAAAIDDTKEAQVSEGQIEDGDEDILDEDDELEVVSLDDAEDDIDDDDDAPMLDDDDDLSDLDGFDDDIDDELGDDDDAILDDDED